MPGMEDGDDPTPYTLDDCFKSVANLIVDHDLHDVRLVAHSWGACVGIGAALLVPERLSLFVPFSSGIPSGISLLDETTEEHRAMFRSQAAASGNNTVPLSFEAWTRDFVYDATPEVQRLTYELLVPQPLQYFTAVVPAINPASMPFTIKYILADEDRVAPRETMLNWCARLGCTYIPTPGGHEAMFTQPERLAEVVLAL